MAYQGKGQKPISSFVNTGWPGSSFEFFDLIKPLTDPESYGFDQADSFDVIIPDIPGFGFSGKPTVSGWGAARVARALDILMTEELRYSRYGAQGGDWGSMISARLGANHADHVCAIHINFACIPIPAPEEEVSILSQEDQVALRASSDFDHKEGAYHLVQETKPDSLTIGQSDSPAGIAAWIIEKFRTWSDCDGNLEKKYSKDQLLTNIMFYWVNNSIASAARLYYESYQDQETHWGAPNPVINTPTAVAIFPHDPFNRPRGWAEQHYNIVRWTNMPSGGHFAAMEEPELLVDDIREYFRNYRSDD